VAELVLSDKLLRPLYIGVALWIMNISDNILHDFFEQENSLVQNYGLLVNLQIEAFRDLNAVLFLILKTLIAK